MKSDHLPVFSKFEIDFPLVSDGDRVQRQGAPRRVNSKGETNPKWDACMNAIKENIEAIPEDVVRSGKGLGPFIDAMHTAICDNAVAKGGRKRATAATEVRRMRGWALVAEELDAEVASPMGAFRIQRLLHEGNSVLQQLLRWLPHLRCGRIDWAALATMLRGWADKMEAGVRLADHRQRQHEFFNRHLDTAWHWAGFAARRGIPLPQSLDRLVEVDTQDLTEVDPAEIDFVDELTQEKCVFQHNDSRMLLKIGSHQGIVRAVDCSAEGCLVVKIANCSGPNNEQRHAILPPWEGRSRTVSCVRAQCKATLTVGKFPDQVERRKTTTEPDRVKQIAREWAAGSDSAAHPGGVPFAEYEEWLDRAGIPVADEAQLAKAERELCRPLERWEFDKHLNKRAGMAAGLDMCTWEILQRLDTGSKNKLFHTLQSMMLHGYDSESQSWPELSHWMRDAWTSPIPKQKSDGTMDRFRGISVTPALARLLGKIITARITNYVEQLGCLCPLQDGFRRGRCTLDTVSRLQAWLGAGEASHLLSADIRRAFDILCSFLTSQLDGSTTRVWTAYGFTPPMDEVPIAINRGTRQGGVESPLLFLLLVDPILHILKRELQVSFEQGELAKSPCITSGATVHMTGHTVEDDRFEVHLRSLGGELWAERTRITTGDGHPDLAQHDGEQAAADVPDTTFLLVEQMEWDPFVVGGRGIGRLSFNGTWHIDIGEDTPTPCDLLQQMANIAQQHGSSHNLQGVLHWRSKRVGARKGFLGGYADDLMLGHKQPQWMLALFKVLGSFYAVVGCTIHEKKSFWLSVHTDPPSKSALGNLSVVPPKGYLEYLGECPVMFDERQEGIPTSFPWEHP
eukprot:gene12137-biopygen76423